MENDPEAEMTKKTIHIHIGPHKTGSTSIQDFLNSNSEKVGQESTFSVINGGMLSRAYKALAEDNIEFARETFQIVAEFVEESQPDNFILSAEDICGELPGRSSRRRPYQHLIRNLKIIREAMQNHKVVFYFFRRDVMAWRRAAYIQNIKFGSKFKSFDQFDEFVKMPRDWDFIVNKMGREFKDGSVIIDYVEAPDFCSVSAFLRSVYKFPLDIVDLDSVRRSNSSLSSLSVALVETVNRSGASPDAMSAAKKSIVYFDQLFGPPEKVEHIFTSEDYSEWPKVIVECSIPSALTGLLLRAKERVDKREQAWLLPDEDVNFSSMWFDFMPIDAKFPDASRVDMEDQHSILSYRFRGYPRPCFVLGLLISYLRRDTSHTFKARNMFQRLWQEEYLYLLSMLPTRWLISTLQTFLDHGANENQRIVGASGFFFMNLMKIYEAERALEGLEPDSIYAHTAPSTKDGRVGLDRFSLGRTDIHLNTISMLLEISMHDEVSGRVLRELLCRIKHGSTVFFRLDKNRQHYDADCAGFKNCWSFFEGPDLLDRLGKLDV